MHKVECPSCAQTIRFETEPKLGQFVTCSTCNTALVVSELNPLTLNWVALNEWTDENPAVYDRRHKSKKHKKRHDHDAVEDFEDDEDELESYDKRRHSKRTRNLDDDYDY